MTEALNSVSVNTVEATPNRIQKFKRKQMEDDYTPRSRHIDKKIPSASLESTPIASSRRNKSEEKENATVQVDGNDDSPEETDSKDVFAVEEFHGHASIGSIMSQPDFSASITRASETDTHDEDSDAEQVTVSPSQSPIQATPRPAAATPPPQRLDSPTRTPRLRDFQLPLTTPRSIVDLAVGGTPGVKWTAEDLISFQTPAPRSSGPQVHRYRDEGGNEMLLDMTPRVYSPRSIPIYTLRDLDTIKAEFDTAKADLEQRVQGLHEELATSVSHANHHRALAAQGESLHAEYSKKHVRKVTALKTDWERKTVERLAAKEARIGELETLVTELRSVLEQEREEKKEVIAMAEAVLALQQQGE